MAPGTTIHPLEASRRLGGRAKPRVAPAARTAFWMVVGLAGAVCAHASAPCIDYGQGPSVRDRLTGDGAVLVANGHAYTGHLSRLLVHDLSTSPATQVAELDLESGSVQGLARAGDVLYAATVQGGIEVVAIVDPQQPIRVTTMALAGEPGRVRVDGARLYVDERRTAAPFYHFRIFDITTPTNPQPLGSTTLDFGGAGFALANDHAYVAMTNGGMQVIDITNPIAPTKRGQFFVPDIVARDIAVRGDRAWLTSAGSDRRVYVLDVANAMAPQAVGEVALPQGGRGIALEGDNAYVAAGSAGFVRLDIARADAPEWVETIDVGSFSTHVDAEGHEVFVGADNGVFAIHAAAESAPPALGAVDTPGNASFVIPVGDLALVMDGDSGMHVVDVADASAPHILGSVATPGFAARAAVSGTHAFLAAGERGPFGLVVVDFSDASAPRLVTELDAGSPAIGVTIVGDRAFVAALTKLHVVDISNPASPTILGSADMQQAVGVAVHGDHAYVVERQRGVTVVDISNAQAPVIVGKNLDAPDANGVVTDGERLYVANALLRLLVVLDLTAPSSPTLLGQLELRTSNFLHLAVSGDLVYTSDGLHVIDVSDPRHPRSLVGSVHVGSDIVAVAVDAERLYLATGTGLEIRPLHCDASTPVELAGLRALADADGVRLRWSTPAEAFVAFDVLRQDRSSGAGYALLPGTARSEARATRWEYLDARAMPGIDYAYEVRGRRTDGSVESFGPVLVTTTGGVARFALHPMRPNPATGSAVVRFELPRREPVVVEVFDVAGRRVRRLFHGPARAGLNVVGWDGLDAAGRPAARGVYLVRYRWPHGHATQRLTLLR